MPQLRTFLVHSRLVNSVTQSPHSLILRKVLREKGSDLEPISSVIRWRNAGKKRQTGVNTRENRLCRASTIPCMRPGRLARSIVVPGSFSSRSFSLLKVSQKCSQLIHMRSCFCLASRLETRNRFQNRQEKKRKKRSLFFITNKNLLD